MKERFWYYTRKEWQPAHRWLPFFGGDEDNRWTIVLPVPFAGYVVIALWHCKQCTLGNYDHEWPRWLRKYEKLIKW